MILLRMIWIRDTRCHGHLLVYRPSAAWEAKVSSKITVIRSQGRIQDRSRGPFLINTLLGHGTSRKDRTYLMHIFMHRYSLFLRLRSFAFIQRPSSREVAPLDEHQVFSQAETQLEDSQAFRIYNAREMELQDLHQSDRLQKRCKSDG